MCTAVIYKDNSKDDFRHNIELLENAIKKANKLLKQRKNETKRTRL